MPVAPLTGAGLALNKPGTERPNKPLTTPCWQTIAATHIETAGSLTNATSYTTGSYTPTADRLQLVAVFAKTAAVDPTLTGHGLTYTKIAKEVLSDFTDTAIFVYRASGGAPTTGVLTIDWGASTQDRCSWSISEFSGATTGGNGADAIAQFATNKATDVNPAVVTLGSAFVNANSATYGAFIEGFATPATAITPGTGFTELGEVQETEEGVYLETEWRVDNDSTVDASFPGAAVPRWGGIAVEIKAAACVPGVVSLDGKGAVADNAKATGINLAEAITGKGAVSNSAKATLNLAERIDGKGAVANNAKATLNVARKIDGKGAVSDNAKASVNVAQRVDGKAAAANNAKADLSIVTTAILEGKAAAANSAKATLTVQFYPPLDEPTTPWPPLHTPMKGSPSVMGQIMQRGLYRHMAGDPVRLTLYLLTDGSVQTETPQTTYNADGTIDEEATSRIRRVFRGGEERTEEERALLTAGGF